MYTSAQLKASTRIQAFADLGGLGWGVLLGNIAKIAIATLRLGLQALRLLREAMPRLLGNTHGEYWGWQLMAFFSGAAGSVLRSVAGRRGSRHDVV